MQNSILWNATGIISLSFLAIPSSEGKALWLRPFAAFFFLIWRQDTLKGLDSWTSVLEPSHKPHRSTHRLTLPSCSFASHHCSVLLNLSHLDAVSAHLVISVTNFLQAWPLNSKDFQCSPESLPWEVPGSWHRRFGKFIILLQKPAATVTACIALQGQL